MSTLRDQPFNAGLTAADRHFLTHKLTTDNTNVFASSVVDSLIPEAALGELITSRAHACVAKDGPNSDGPGEMHLASNFLGYRKTRRLQQLKPRGS